MSEENQQFAQSEVPSMEDVNGIRYSLKEMMAEVVIERRDSVFGRELVDATEIDKMFGKQIQKKKKK